MPINAEALLKIIYKSKIKTTLLNANKNLIR